MFSEYIWQKFKSNIENYVYEVKKYLGKVISAIFTSIKLTLR